MKSDRFASRRSRLIKKIRSAGVDALLVTSVTNVSYLTGFTGDSSYLLIGPKHERLISDSRYETQLEEECPGLDAFIRTSRTLMADATAQVLKSSGIKKLAIEAGHVTVEQYEQWKEKSAEVEWLFLSDTVEELRQIKDADEIAQIRQAIRMAERGFLAARAAWVPEMTELEAAHELEHLMRRFGATKAAFDPIVAAGPRSALPHARASSAPLSTSGFVLVDWGATTPAGYRSDLTRVIATGKLPPKLGNLYRVVLKSQLAAFEAIRPGAKCVDVDAIARKAIDDEKAGPCFTHGLGHGIGLDIHEGPRFAATSKSELQPGMVITLEPAIYVPGFGGVRIEDDVLVTKDGCEWLSSLPKDWDFAIGP